MTISSNLTSLFDGSYLARVQDALGNSGATATLNGDGSVKLTGTPTGAGLKAEAAAATVATKTSTNKDSVSLSPTAQAALTNQAIGLKLILAAKAGTGSTAAEATGSASPTGSVPSTPPPATIDASDVTALAREDPTQVIHDVVGAAQTPLLQSRPPRASPLQHRLIRLS